MIRSFKEIVAIAIEIILGLQYERKSIVVVFVEQRL